MLFKSYIIRTLLGFVGGIVLLYVFIPNNNKTQFEDLALGEGTMPVYNLVNGKKIHCNDMDNIKECVAAYQEQGLEKSVILWLGNSQLHAINQPNPNDITASTELHQKFQLKDLYFLTYSQPNANLQEHYILFAHSLTYLPVTTLVLPVVFDDMREDGIRTSLTSIFEDLKVAKFLNQGDLGTQLYYSNLNQSRTNNDLAGLNDTPQERFEFLLNQWLENIWPIWNSRKSFRGRFLNFLYISRNWLFGINPSSVRKMIPGRYAKNLQAFSETLDLASNNRVNVFVYVVPLRNDVKAPYQPEQYKAFKSEVERLTKQKGFYFSNFENLVPSDFWGLKDNTVVGGSLEIDFMHFKEGGHRLLADSIHKKLMELSYKK